MTAWTLQDLEPLSVSEEHRLLGIIPILRSLLVEGPVIERYVCGVCGCLWFSSDAACPACRSRLVPSCWLELVARNACARSNFA